jgi:hypothetical protein
LARRADGGEDPGVDEPAETLRGIRARWDEATRDGGPACGLDVVEHSYVDMQTAWFAELGVYLQIAGRTGGQ